MAELERHLCRALQEHPRKFGNVYNDVAQQQFLEILFRSLTNDNPEYLQALFPNGFPSSYKLSDAQGAHVGAEYTEAARGHPCGHILKQGEASYKCKTCSDDDTACLCSRCFDASDHEGHNYSFSISPGNTGCCDCGDEEAWKIPVNCAIHTARDDEAATEHKSDLPQDLINAIRLTIGRVLDYFCDVVSCSPEQLRLPKSFETIQRDEAASRLTSEWYGREDDSEIEPEYSLVLWNDEKHTVDEVTEQVKRACKERTSFGERKANEVNDVGRAVVRQSRDLEDLLKKAAIIEQIKVTVTIRSSRDTFREQMCGTIIEWLTEIAACSVGNDTHILRATICEELLKPWRIGSEAKNARIGRSGLYDNEAEDRNPAFGIRGDRQRRLARMARLGEQLQVGQVQQVVDTAGNPINVVQITNAAIADDDEDDEDDDDDAEGFEDQEMGIQQAAGTFEVNVEDQMEIDYHQTEESDDERNMDSVGADDDLEVAEATMAGYPPPPPPPTRGRQPGAPTTSFTPPESEMDESHLPEDQSRNFRNIPRTPKIRSKYSRRNANAPNHWKTKPAGYTTDREIPQYEDLTKNIRLDSMILFDLRLWKKTRIELRDLLITTVVNIPAFKRILGLRFAGLYTPLSQLYLIADREPDHSIINLSLQMLTTQSITSEVMERGNFLTNLMAILCTFLTSRQVGYPEDVSSDGTLAFDAGSVANRRLYHFFSDMRFFLGSEAVQKKVRTERQYLLQFLDLAKLCQGICPNVRAVGEHVEYETDAWISASLLTREINKLCRQFAESFRHQNGKEADSTSGAISETALVAIINSSGLERTRFDVSEIKDWLKFKLLEPFDFDNGSYGGGPTRYKVVEFVVNEGALSFHHALHYTLSWLIECGKAKSVDQLKATLSDAARQFIKHHRDQMAQPELWVDPEDALMALFDFPLRVCAWLAQMKAGMWVRNGLSLRHQMSQYKGVQHRDVAHLRDIFLLQTALVTCDPSRVLASVIDRFGLDDWMRGRYAVRTGLEDAQLVDLAEDFIYLLIVLISERNSLLTLEDEHNPRLATLRKDIIHTLCFKPLSFSDLSQRLHERYQDYDEFTSVLEEMTNYKAPEGLTDSGMFELKPDYLEHLDPYNASYNKNQRDEAENIYKMRMSKKTNKRLEDIVLEPKLRQIRSGTFEGLSAFTNTPLFAQIIYYALGFALKADREMPSIPKTRVDAYLHVVLHLILVATQEDDTAFEDFTEESFQSFIYHALKSTPSKPIDGHTSIISELQKISIMDAFVSCSAKIKHILRLFCRKRLVEFKLATTNLNFPYGRLDTGSPAVEIDVEARKKLALERQKKVMAQFQQQQQKFMDNQGVVDWGDDLSDEEPEMIDATGTKVWKYPSGVCILCQEETNDSRLYGTFSMIMESSILRQTNINDTDWVREVHNAPASLDRSADEIRPFGVAGENHEEITKLTSSKGQVLTTRQGLGKGFPGQFTQRGPVATGCGHIMHYSCFETYYSAIGRRQQVQIARNHPERLKQKEFVCPLCKALGNAFFPIIWKGKEECYPGALETETSFDDFLVRTEESAERINNEMQYISDDRMISLAQQEVFRSYTSKTLIPSLANSVERGSMTSPVTPTSSTSPFGRFSLPNTLSNIFFSPIEEHPGSAIPPRGAESVELTPTAELMSIYRRLRDTLNNNKLTSYGPTENTSPYLEHVDTLAASVGFSISAVEIAHRGLESQPGTTLLDRVPQSQLTHLRILSDTAFSYASVGSLRAIGPQVRDFQLRQLQNRQFSQLFVFSANNHVLYPHRPLEPLLKLDAFNFLAECSVILSPIADLEIHHLSQLCYTAEIVRVILAYMRSPMSFGEEVKTRFLASNRSLADPSDQQRLFGAMEWLSRELALDLQVQPPNVEPFLNSSQAPEGLTMLHSLISAYALAFVRKATILFHVHHGVDIPSTGLTDLDQPELARLTRALRLPSLSDVLASLSPVTGNTPLKVIVKGWLYHLSHGSTSHSNKQVTSALTTQHPLDISLAHPAILELVGLPKFYDVLIEECHIRKCPTTGKELTDPSVCLFCGAIFCSQAVCCMQRKRGGCNLHMSKCGGNIGLFLNIRKCTVLFTHHENGSWYHAPYLTRHGEVDPGLRQHHQLILNQKRYDRLIRDVWLNHGVCSVISRKLEGDVNNGGWETI
ncbi:MAG: hypothetical protein Q9160_002119 [Pyrenula sp. 1 TL-2023]